MELVDLARLLRQAPANGWRHLTSRRQTACVAPLSPWRAARRLVLPWATCGPVGLLPGPAGHLSTTTAGRASDLAPLSAPLTCLASAGLFRSRTPKLLTAGRTRQLDDLPYATVAAPLGVRSLCRRGSDATSSNTGPFRLRPRSRQKKARDLARVTWVSILPKPAERRIGRPGARLAPDWSTALCSLTTSCEIELRLAVRFTRPAHSP